MKHAGPQFAVRVCGKVQTDYIYIYNMSLLEKFTNETLKTRLDYTYILLFQLLTFNINPT